MLTAAVCDDELEVNLELCRLIKKHLPECETQSFMSGEELLREKKDFDLIFLDIKMKRIDGMETAEKLRSRGSKAAVIFVSGLKEYVFGAFDVGAFHYLLKPVNEEKLSAVLKRAADEILNKPEKRRLLIKAKDRNISIDVGEILYLENEMRKIAAHTLNGTVEFYGAMNEIETQLNEDFFRCHRGYLVNLGHIAEYSSTEITVTNGDKVYISKSRYPDFVKSYHRFLRAKGAHDD